MNANKRKEYSLSAGAASAANMLITHPFAAEAAPALAGHGVNG